MSDMTPAAARELLHAEAFGLQHGDDLITRAWIGAAMSVFIGLLMGAFLLAGAYLLPTTTAGGALLLSAGYVAGILIAVGAYNLFRTSTPPGWVRRYQKGLAISCAVFAVALALSFIVAERTPILWVPLAIAVALPISVYGVTRARR